jgi:hypothetical protein
MLDIDASAVATQVVNDQTLRDLPFCQAVRDSMRLLEASLKPKPTISITRLGARPNVAPRGIDAHLLSESLAVIRPLVGRLTALDSRHSSIGGEAFLADLSPTANRGCVLCKCTQRLRKLTTCARPFLIVITVELGERAVAVASLGNRRLKPTAFEQNDILEHGAHDYQPTFPPPATAAEEFFRLVGRDGREPSGRWRRRLLGFSSAG